LIIPVIPNLSRGYGYKNIHAENKKYKPPLRYRRGFCCGAAFLKSTPPTFLMPQRLSYWN
jgi:hypothetical protein